MQIILIKDLDTLGQKNELVNVKPGYARNYLIPNKIAIEASAGNKAVMLQRAKQILKQENALLAEIAAVTAKLQESPVRLTAKTGTSGRIFGAITSIQVARAIREQKGYEIDRKRISVSDEIKELGDYKIHINFGGAEPVEVDVTIVAEA
jgi:large subunit ribosomal protein L9